MIGSKYEHYVESYRLAMKAEADAWRLSNPEAFKEANEFAMATYHGEVNGFRRRVEALTRQCAEHAGFPGFHAWVEARVRHPSHQVRAAPTQENAA